MRGELVNKRCPRALCIDRETVANRAPEHAQSFSGDPKNCLPNQCSVIAVLIGRGTMTKLDVDDARPFVGMIPGDRVSACGVVGCQQRVCLGIDPIMIVGLINNIEVVETLRDRIRGIGDVHMDLLTVFVG